MSEPVGGEPTASESSRQEARRDGLRRRLQRIRHEIREFGRFLLIVWRRAGAEGIGLRASALAFITVVSLVPLLAAFAAVGARAFTQYQRQLLDFLTEILPYSEEATLAALERFVAQAETIRGPGLIGFAIVVLGVFFAVEETINRTWEASARRPWSVRLVSYLLLLATGPLLIGTALSGLYNMVEQLRTEPLLAGTSPLAVLPTLATALGLTLLYALVPNTHVRARSALLGGVLASAGLELLRRGFVGYLDLFGRTNQIVYGGFAVAFFFMVSLQVGWWIVLAGNLVAYCHQHRRAMLGDREGEREHLASDPWLGLAALALLAEHGERGERPLGLSSLAEELAVAPPRLQRALAPLESAGLVVRTRLYSPRFAASRGALASRVGELLRLYERELADDLPAVGPFAGITAMRTRFLRGFCDAAGDRTLAEAIGRPAPAAPPSTTGAIAGGAAGVAPPAASKVE